MDTIIITPADTRYTVRETLRSLCVQQPAMAHVLIVLGWDVVAWDQPWDYEVLAREAQAHASEIAWVIEDAERRPLARAAGFPVFNSAAAAQDHVTRRGHFPALRRAPLPPQPQRDVWAEEAQPRRRPDTRPPALWLVGLELALFLGVLSVVICAGAISIPSAHITLHPQGITYQQMVLISVDPEAEEVDLQRGVIPAQAVGDEFEAYAEVQTTGRGESYTGKAEGSVRFTNLLGQEYRIPAGTIVRTTASSYPVRYETMQEVVAPPFGQADAAVEALESGPRGNVGAHQINLVEGVIGFALRVTNPGPISGAESSTVLIVSEADRQAARAIATRQVLLEAYQGLRDNYVQPGEYLPRQNLLIQAAPKAAYTHLVGEETTTLGLALRLLVSGYKIQATDAQAIAYRQLAARLPKGYTLRDARFEYGESAEEDVGPGNFTFYMTAYGYASADLDVKTALAAISGKSPEAAQDYLQNKLALAAPPEIHISPDWFPTLPFLTARTTIEVVPGKGW